MPTHIFTRLGLWQKSIDANLASAGTAREQVSRTHPGAASFDALHALDYLVYAYLQIDDQRQARAAADEAAVARRFDEPSFAAGYAIAAIPATAWVSRVEGRHDEADEALIAFEKSLMESPNRFNSLAGAASAAARSGQRDKAREFYHMLLLQANESRRREVRDARAFLGRF